MTWNEWKRYFPKQPYRKILDELPVPHSAIDEMFRHAQLFASRGNMNEAEAAYKQAVAWVIETYNVDRNLKICKQGIMDNLEEIVKPACELASKLDKLKVTTSSQDASTFLG